MDTALQVIGALALAFGMWAGAQWLEEHTNPQPTDRRWALAMKALGHAVAGSLRADPEVNDGRWR